MEGRRESRATGGETRHSGHGRAEGHSVELEAAAPSRARGADGRAKAPRRIGRQAMERDFGWATPTGKQARDRAAWDLATWGRVTGEEDEGGVLCQAPLEGGREIHGWAPSSRRGNSTASSTVPGREQRDKHREVAVCAQDRNGWRKKITGIR